MLKFQDKLSQQEHPSQSGRNPECDDQPLQRRSLLIRIASCISLKATAGRAKQMFIS